MKLSVGRWTTTRSALAVAGALAIAGAIGSALAVSPINSGPSIKWAGGAEFAGFKSSGQAIFTVPSNQNLMLTDLVVTNLDPSTQLFNLTTGNSNCSALIKNRLFTLAVPTGETLTISLTTGIGVPGGQSVCVVSSGGGGLYYNARGYFFTPVPAG